MTLLQYEQNRIDERFDAAWGAWQVEHRVAAPFLRRDAGAIWDHFPLVLYEYHPTVPLRTARAIALASRAAGAHGHLLQSCAGGGWPADLLDVAADWLVTFARDQLAECPAAEGALLREFDAAQLRCRDAVARERRTLLEPRYPPERFAEIVHDKAAPAYATLSALATAAGAPVIAAVTMSQRHVYTGLHLYRDVVEWRADHVSGASSYFLCVLLHALGMTPAGDAAGRETQCETLGRYIYHLGLAEETLALSSEHFCRAAAAVTALPATAWRTLLTQLLDRGERLRSDLRDIRARSCDRASASRPTTCTPQPTPFYVHDAMVSAARYLTREQDAEGLWGDFLLSGEQSTFWTTGYVGWTLARTSYADDELARAARRLVASQAPGGGWGYNANWPIDADTIANVLLFLSGRADVERSSWASALDILFAHQHADGGFATFADADAWIPHIGADAHGLRGWMASHPCVTAVIALLLARLDSSRCRLRAAEALEYLRAQQRPDGSWDAYWWVGRLYTTCRVLQAMQAMGNDGNSLTRTRAAAWLVGSQRPDGGWALSDHHEASQVFPTALALQALCALDGSDAQHRALRRGVGWLVEHQRRDGSWPAQPMMLRPAPYVMRPWERTDWRESVIGFDIVVPDWRRLFTTATAAQALWAVAARS